MKQTLDVINRMEADGIIGRYAIAGAVAAYNYIEPALTIDLDILVSIDTPALEPAYSYLKKKGYDEHREEGIVIEGWPVQFLTVASQLNVEALAEAGDVDIEMNKAEGSVKIRILRPEHIVANALRVGGPQDFTRVTQFLQENAVNLAALCVLLDRHKLKDAWQSFCKRVGLDDPETRWPPMTDPPKDVFPDISDILARKAEGRRMNAARTFGEKIAMMEALRERLEPFKRAREARQAKRKKSSE